MRWVVFAIGIGACVPQPDFAGMELPPAGYITVEIAGTGKGHVVSDPLGIDCPSACTAPFVPGTIVMLSVTSDEGSTLVGWSGSCSGNDACTVDTTVGARAVVELDCVEHDETLMIPGGYPVTVPSCVTQMTLDVFGGQGGAAGTIAVGGRGGAVHATIEVTSGETLFATVGAGGSPATSSGTGGSNGGGKGTSISTGGGGGGGGASDVRRDGTTAADRIIVAAGGGGAVTCNMHLTGIAGAAGGGDVGETPAASICTNGGLPATGGTQSVGGAAGKSGSTPTMCDAMSANGASGGDGCSPPQGGGGGGGGGYFGGGGGAWGPGAGGSNLTPPNATTEAGVSTGNGSIRLRW